MVVMRLFILTLLSIVLLDVNAMAITINIYYTGEKGNARKFAEEMEQSGVAAAIRADIPIKDKSFVKE